jgi:putative FmdB family regulatory protein
MPIYEYHCNKCDNTFECLVFGSESPSCPDCNNENVNRVLSACGFVSKSGGGQTATRSAGTSACSGCSATSCGSCGH